MNKLTLEEASRYHFSMIDVLRGTTAYEPVKAPEIAPVPTPAGELHPKYRKNAILYTMGEKAQPLAHWAKEYGIGTETVRARMKRGMSMMDALTTPLQPLKNPGKSITFNGRTLNIQQWADELGLSLSGLSRRLSNPEWTLEEALTHFHKAKGEDA